MVRTQQQTKNLSHVVNNLRNLWPRPLIRTQIADVTRENRSLTTTTTTTTRVLILTNECPFSGVTKSGRVWRKVPESGARSVTPAPCSSTQPASFLRIHANKERASLANTAVWGEPDLLDGQTDLVLWRILTSRQSHTSSGRITHSFTLDQNTSH